jgi:hypothetical protein
MLYALCSNSECDFSIELQDKVAGRPVATPKECPRCNHPIISFCPNCGFILTGNADAKICELCKEDIQVSFAKIQPRAQTA